MLLFLKYLLEAISTVAITLAVMAVVAIIYYNHELPDYRQLAEYRPATITRLYAADGSLLEEYARQRRVFVPIRMIPDVVRQAFIAAEDRNFYSNPGIDLTGIIRATLHNLFTDNPLQGASTITQQVAKNMLLTNERTLKRKMKETLLAIRMNFAFSKEKILELYLNDIYLGAGSYGVAAAAAAYFDKSVDELTVQEAALLAAMPKAPATNDPFKNPTGALERRNWVLAAMSNEGYISKDIATQASLTAINLKPSQRKSADGSGFFAEEVRRELFSKFGPDTLYNGGLTVHTTLDPQLQTLAQKALRNGLVNYSLRHGFGGPLAHINTDESWSRELATIEPPAGVGDWKMAVVLKVTDRVSIGFADGTTSYITFESLKWADTLDQEELKKKPTELLAKGDVILVEEKKASLNPKSKPTTPYILRQIPEVNGALVAMDPHSGRVLAMIGGFTFESSKFNRAVQAKRQPGSAFKPFVYLTALENGFTPADLIADEPVEITTADGNDAFAIWSPRNYTGNFYGPTTLRRGVEKSINVMTVHLSIATGLDKILDMTKRLKINDNPPQNITAVLGTAETDLLSLTTAYSILANGGRQVMPSLFERIHDRDGKIIYRRDNRECLYCDLSAVANSRLSTPDLPDIGIQLINKDSAFQIVSILEGAVERGTATDALKIEKPIAGKTGTTNNSIDSWFIGFSPDLVVGVYVGFDIPRSLGEKEQGATIALPIFVDFMKEALKDKPATPFRIPEGIKLVKIDAQTGFLPSSETPKNDVILEAFKSGTEPERSALRSEALPVINPREKNDSDEFLPNTPTTRGTGGIY